MSSRLAFQSQLASIMEVLANAAVAEICKLVEDEYAVVSLQMSQSQRENKALKRKLHLLELKMARGAAERRLRDGGGRARVQLSDRLREAGPDPGVFDQPMEVSLWSTRALGHAPSDAVLSQSLQAQPADVEPEHILVKEENVEASMSPMEEPEEEVRLIGDDGVLECASRGAAAQRPSLEHQESRSQIQTQSNRTRDGSRGVEKEEEPDVVLVKVEEVELANQKSLSIQEGLVESSTDNYRGALPFDETTQSSSNQLSDLQESGQSFSEVSYGHSSLWSNGAGSYGDSLPGPSSDCTLFSYPPTTLVGVQAGGSERGWAEEEAAGKGLAAEHSRGFSNSSFEQQLPVIDLSEESSPPQVSGQMQAGLQHFLNPSQSQGQKGSSKKLCMCSFCGKGFRSPANLESHLRTHTGERPYGCIICGKKFSQFWNLKIHNNIHTGERPYQCPLCLEKFSDPSNLKKHQKRHHPPDGGKPPATS